MSESRRVPEPRIASRGSHDLPSLLAAAYLRLLAARRDDRAQQKQLDVVDENEAPLSQRVSRRKRRD